MTRGMRYNWVKTQCGGVAAHVGVCMILAYVKERYAPDLEVRDDSGYFERGDIRMLEEKLAQVDFLLDRFREAANRLDREANLTPQPVRYVIEQLCAYFDEARRRLH